MKRLLLATVAGMTQVTFGASNASASPPQNPRVTVWEHGGSNPGECSSYLATAFSSDPRPGINEAIRLYGSLLPDGPYPT